MMTVGDFAAVLEGTDTLHLDMNGYSREVFLDDNIDMESYKDFVIKKITMVDGVAEVMIDMVPRKRALAKVRTKR